MVEPSTRGRDEKGQPRLPGRSPWRPVVMVVAVLTAAVVACGRQAGQAGRRGAGGGGDGAGPGDDAGPMSAAPDASGDATAAPDAADVPDHGDRDTSGDEGPSPPASPPPADAGEDPTDLRVLGGGTRGRVDHVVDGDTLHLKVVAGRANRVFIIRLKGLAAPECRKDHREGLGYACVADDEYYGLASFETLLRMANGAEAVVVCDVPQGAQCEKDTFDRYLAYLEVDGVDLSTEMARAGAGFSFTRYPASRRAQICQAEEEARRERRGMWALGSTADVLSRMNANTREWYRDHDRLCRAAAP